MKKILITGSCSFTFGNFVRKVIYEKLPYSLSSIDRVRPNSLNSVYWNKSHSFHIGNICDQQIVDTIFQIEKPEIVIHAAESSIDFDNTNPNDHIATNVLGTQTIINACSKFGVERLLFCSSDKVLGYQSDNKSSNKEDAILNPQSAYAASKASAELLVKSAQITNGLNYNILRSSNIYGPRQTVDKFVPKIIKSIINKEKIPVYGNGKQVRDWLHVFDNCSAILKILEVGKLNETYHISANNEISNLHLINKICEELKVKSEDHVSYVEDKVDNYFRYSLDSSKLRTLGWKPKMDFEKGIQENCVWYQNNKWMLK